MRLQFEETAAPALERERAWPGSRLYDAYHLALTHGANRKRRPPLSDDPLVADYTREGFKAGRGLRPLPLKRR